MGQKCVSLLEEAWRQGCGYFLEETEAQIQSL